MVRGKAESHRTDASGFTLVELLVVVSVISLIMAIILPSIASGRRQGQRVACLSNLRNLTQGWMMYAMDSDDKLCSARTDWDVPPENHWVADGPYIPTNTLGGTGEAIRNGVLWPHVSKTLEVYKCKGDRSERLRSYALAESMNGRMLDTPSDPQYRRLGDIKPAGQRMVFVDAECRTPWIVGAFPLPSTDLSGRYVGWLVNPTHTITARHSDGCNVSFADGHCEYLKYRDPRTIRPAKIGGSPRGGLDNLDIQRFLEWVPRCRFVEADPNERETE